MANPKTTTFTIRLTENIHALCFPAAKDVPLFVGDSIQFVPDPANLPFRIVFDTPFSTPAFEITDQKPRTLQVPGRFFFKCFMTRGDGVEVGWHPGEDPESGGDPDVKP